MNTVRSPTRGGGQPNQFVSPAPAQDFVPKGHGARLDLICQVENLTYFLTEAGQTIAVLEASTFDGLPIRGEDTVNIVRDQVTY